MGDKPKCDVSTGMVIQRYGIKDCLKMLGLDKRRFPRRYFFLSLRRSSQFGVLVGSLRPVLEEDTVRQFD